MIFQKSPRTIIQPQPFPDAVAKHETAVIDADHGLCLGDNLTV